MRPVTAIFMILALMIATSPAARADEISELKAQLATANAKIESLEKQLAELKAAEKEKPIVGPLGATWNGKTVDQKGATIAAEWSVIAREGHKITFRTTTELGNIWEYDGEFLKTNPRDFKIVDARRIKAADGNTNPTNVGAVVGNGSITGENLHVRTTWGNAKLVAEFKGTSKDAETSKKAKP